MTQVIITPSVPIYKSLLYFSHFLRKIVSPINVFTLCVNITKLSCVCIRIKFDFFIFQNKLVIFFFPKLKLWGAEGSPTALL